MVYQVAFPCHQLFSACGSYPAELYEYIVYPVESDAALCAVFFLRRPLSLCSQLREAFLRGAQQGEVLLHEGEHILGLGKWCHHKSIPQLEAYGNMVVPRDLAEHLLHYLVLRRGGRSF